jgi:hypothetical protein
MLQPQCVWPTGTTLPFAGFAGERASSRTYGICAAQMGRDLCVYCIAGGVGRCPALDQLPCRLLGALL